MNLRQLRKLVNETVRSEQRKSRRGRGRTSQRWNTLVENTTRRVLFEGDDDASGQESGGDSSGLISVNAGPAEIVAAAKEMADPQSNFNQEAKDDEKIEFKDAGPYKASELRPTQAEIGAAKSLNDQCTNQYDALKKVLEGGLLGPAGGTPILIFEGAGQKYVLDGHHRWSQFLCTAPNEEIVQCVAISAPGVTTPEAALGLCHAVQFALHGQSVTKDFSGPNLLEKTEEQIQAIALELIEGGEGGPNFEEVLKLLSDAGLVDADASKEDVAKYYAGNLAKLKEMKGDFTRKVMPQMAEDGQKTDITAPPEEATDGGVEYKEIKTESIDLRRWNKLAGILKD